MRATVVRSALGVKIQLRLIGEITGLKLNSNQPMSVVHGENISILVYLGTYGTHNTDRRCTIIWKHIARARPVGAACWDWLDIQSEFL